MKLLTLDGPFWVWLSGLATGTMLVGALYTGLWFFWAALGLQFLASLWTLENASRWRGD